MYTHKVQCYETDRMGVTHHSNYIRWMEEARVAYMETVGWPYDRFEKEGILSPVVAVEAKYLRTTTFPDEVEIDVKVRSFRGVRLVLEYEMRKADTSEKVFEGTSEHCFLGEDNRPIRMAKRYPEFYEVLCGE